MKITPITNNNSNQNINISHRGTIGTALVSELDSYSIKLNKTSANAADKYPTIKKFCIKQSEYISKYVSNILQNLRTVMSRFGESCVLNFYKSEKNPDKACFVIESVYSDYKHICGEVSMSGSANNVLQNLDDFTRTTLVKINPYEVNRNFRIMTKNSNTEFFAAEKDFMFPEDKLVDCVPAANKESEQKIDLSIYAEKLNAEMDAYRKEFRISNNERLI